jgi:hypothetical protein
VVAKEIPAVHLGHGEDATPARSSRGLRRDGWAGSSIHASTRSSSASMGDDDDRFALLAHFSQ